MGSPEVSPEPPSTPPLPRWTSAQCDKLALTNRSDGEKSSTCRTGSRGGRVYFASKKPLMPRRPRSPRRLCFTKPTPVRRVVPPAPQPLGCAAMNLPDRYSRPFEVPPPELRRAAIGGTGGMPFLMQRVLRFAETWFEPITEPRSHDWLGRHRELMQNYEAFRVAWEEQRDQLGPTEERRVMHLMALGPEEPAPKLMQALQEAVAAFFSPLRVAVISSHRPELKPRRRSQPGSLPQRCIAPGDQLVSEEVLTWLAGGLRSDSVVTVAVTLSPVMNCGKAVVGATDWSRRVGVFSVASSINSEEPLSCLSMERAVKFLLHQVPHMFGILHCCYFRCLMNGAAHQEEADGRPPYLCAMCLKKLHLVTGLDPLLRYLHLARFWAWLGHPQIALWYETRVRVVRSTFSNAQIQLPPTPRLQRPRKGRQSPLRLQDKEPGTQAEEPEGDQRAWWREPAPQAAESEFAIVVSRTPGADAAAGGADAEHTQVAPVEEGADEGASVSP